MKEERLSQLAEKDVIDLRLGARLGSVRDALIDLRTGRVTALIVPGRLKSLGLLGREEELFIPWEALKQVGEDLIFVRSRGTGEETAEKAKLPEKNTCNPGGDVIR